MFDTDEDRSLADRRRDATREGIVDAAWAICRRDGLGALSLRDLGKEVGLKASSLYAYFDSKAAIYDAMFLEGYQQFELLVADFVDALDAGTDARALLRRTAVEFVQFCRSDPARYQLMFQRVLPDFEPTAETYAVSVRQLEAFAGALRALGVDDPQALDLWTALVTGLADQQISNDPGGERWLRLASRAADMFCDHVGIPPETPGGDSR